MGLTLYEIRDEYLDALNQIQIDDETGEIINIETLQNVQGEFEDKAEAVAIFIKSIKAEAGDIHEEIDNLKARETALKNKADRLMDYLAYNIKAVGRYGFQTSKCVVSCRHTDVVAIQDEFLIPEGYMKVKVEKKPDKTLIKKAIKEGKVVAGAALIPNESWSVK